MLFRSDNGWLIPPLNQKAIEEKMIEIINADAEIIERKKAASVQKVKEHFMWDKVILKEINAIKKAINFT